MTVLERRRVERQAAAIVRAVSGQPTADLRARRLSVGETTVAMATPYLAMDHAAASLAASRGVADALGLLLRFSDFTLHRELRPDDAFARVVFDILEQVRSESLAPEGWRGFAGNLDHAFRSWAAVADSSVGLLLFTVAHMARARLIRAGFHTELEDMTEVTRGNLAPLIGHALGELFGARHDQRAYAEPASEIAQVVADFAGAAAAQALASLATHGIRVMLPEDKDTAESGQSTLTLPTYEPGDYYVYTRAYDREITGTSLYPEATRASLRATLDRQVTAQAVSIPRLAQRLRVLLAQDARDSWQFGTEDGVVDAKRLAQLVADPGNRDVFRRERYQPRCDAVVGFLIDNSGSMKLQRFEAVAVLVDTFCRALDLAGATSEVLGFTTGGWNGGRARDDWMRDGRPADPGRLNELRHIVYKDADTPWRRARSLLASMMRTLYFREGVDGEALAWAHHRLINRPESRRMLIVISDGVPMDSASTNANRAGFLVDHLRAVAEDIDHTGAVELGAIGIDLDVSDFYRRSISLDLTGTLSIGSYGVLERLFDATMAR